MKKLNKELTSINNYQIIENPPFKGLQLIEPRIIM